MLSISGETSDDGAVGTDSGSVAKDEGTADAGSTSSGGTGGSDSGHGSDHSAGGHGDAGGDHSHHGDSIDWLKEAIQGEPGVDYPIYGEVPSTGFKCSDQKWPGKRFDFTQFRLR